MQPVMRGHTWSEQHRHECEVRYVCNLGGKAARDAYLADIAKRRGQAAADRLAADGRDEWARRRLEGEKPRTPQNGAKHLDGAAGRGFGERTPMVQKPGEGSFRPAYHEGRSRPDGSVHSGESA